MTALTPARAVLVAALAVLGVAFALHAPALGNTFHNPDDWYYLSLSWDVQRGVPGAFQHLMTGHGLRAFRPLGGLVWMANWAASGLYAAPYYATNIALGALTAAATLFLTFALARPAAAEDTSGPLIASGVAAGLVLFAASTNQGLLFLSARDDYLCAMLLASSAGVWALGSRWPSSLLAAALLGLACLGKPMALIGPALLFCVDLARGRLPTRQLGPWLRYLLPILAVLLYAFYARELLFSFASGIAPPGMPQRPATLSALLSNLEHAFFRPYPFDGGWVRPVWLAVIAAAGLVAGTVHWRLVGVGVAWIVINLPAPWSYVATDPMAGARNGRYLLLASIGFALVMGGLLAAPRKRLRDRRAWGAALTLVVVLGVGSAAEYAATIRPMLSFRTTRVESLITDLAALDADAPQGAWGVLAVQRADSGILAALGSTALSSVAPRLGHGLRFYVEGMDTLFRQRLQRDSREVWDGYGQAREPLDIDWLTEEGGLLIAADDASGGTRWTQVDALPPRVAGTSLPAWTFAGTDAGWVWRGGIQGGPGGAFVEAGPAGITVRAPSTTPQMGANLLGAMGWTGALVSPPIDVSAPSVCAADIALRVGRSGPRSVGHRDPIVPDGLAVAMTWSGDSQLGDPWQRMVTAPVRAGPGTARLLLGQSVTWRSSGAVRAIGLRVLGTDEVEVQSVRLVGCAP